MKRIYFCLIIIVTVSCSISKDKNSFSGNWSACGDDGFYVEMIIKDQQFKYATQSGFVTGWYDYTINGDTLTYYDPYLYKDSVFVIKSKIHFGKDEMILDYITSDEHWTFKRLKEEITEDENKEKILEGTRKRAEKAGCIDKRPEEKKLQDSLIKPINFQF